MSVGGHTVVLIDPPGRDGNGDPLPGPGAETEVEGCNVQQQSTEEVVNGRHTVVTRLALFAPPGTPILLTSQIRHKGVTYMIDGRPADMDDLHGEPHHVFCWLKEVTG